MRIRGNPIFDYRHYIFDTQNYNQMRFVFLFLCVTVFSVTVSAQARSLKDIRNDIDNIHAANDAAIKTISPNRGLIEPRKLNVMIGDLEKLYFNISPESGRLHMTTGDILSANIRYRLFDQIMEVEYDGETYAMDLSMVKAFTIGESNFVLLPDPLRRQNGRIIHQVHYVDEKNLVLEQHWTEEDHREKLNNVPATDSQYLRRASNVILAIEDEATSINGQNDAFKALGIRSKKSKAGRYTKANRLKLRQAEDLSKLVAYMTNNDLI